MKNRSRSSAGRAARGNRPLRFAVVGLGHIAQAAVLPAFRHARGFAELVALVSDTKFLGDTQRELILNRQRDVVAAFTRFIRRAYPERMTPANQTALTMMLFGMINWTFTWLRPGGPMSYAAFADEVVAVLEKGLGG